MELSDCKTAEDVLELLKEVPENFNGTLLGVLAQEIINLRKQLAGQRLLIEHEEKVRVTKAKPTTGQKTVLKFLKGDLIKRIKDDKPGTIIRTSGSRAFVRFADNTCWVDKRSLVHTIAR